MSFVGIQTWDVGEFFATALFETLFDFFVNFFECFYAVR